MMEWLDDMVRNITGSTILGPIKAEYISGPSSVENYTGSNCGDALACYLNSGPLKESGYSLPRGGIGPGDLANIGNSLGSAVYGKKDISPENLTPGTVIHMTRQPRDRYYEHGKTHIGIVDIDEHGNKVFKSFTAGKGWRSQLVNQKFISQLPNNITASNLVNPELSSKTEEYYQALKNPGERQTPQQFTPYQIASAGTKIPKPPAIDFDPNGPDVSYLDGLITGKNASTPTISIDNTKPQTTEQMPLQNTAPAPFHAQVGAAYVDEPQTKFKILAKFRFPHEDPEIAAKRYFMREGDVFYMTNDGKIHKEAGEGFGEKAKTFLASLLGRAPEIVGGALGAASPVPGGMELGTVLGGLGRRASNQAYYGEKPDYLTGGITDAAGAALSRIPAAGITKGLDYLGKGGQIGRMVAREPGTFDATEAQRLIDLGNQYGIRLTAPEITNSPTLQSLWSNLAQNPRWPSANQKMAEFIKQTRNPEIAQAIRSELSSISPYEDISPFDSGSIVTQTAKNILGDLKSTRATESHPLYETAFKSSAAVDTQPVLNQIDSLLAVQPEGSSGSAALMKVKRMLERSEDVWDTQTNKTIKRNIPETNIETLHNAKLEIDNMIDAAKQDKSISNTMRQRLASIKENLLTQIDQASPEYGQARSKFAELSGPINKFQYGTSNLGPRDPKVKTIMQRLVDLGAEDMEKVPGIIFGAKPETIARTKRWFSANGYDSEWNTIIRSHLEQRLNQVADSIASREGNIGYAFKRKVFGKGEDVEKLKSGMSAQQFSSFRGLMELMDQTTKIVYTNSQTAMQQGATQAIENMGGGVVGRALSNVPVTPQQWGQVLIRLRSPGNASKLADVLLDPATAPRIRSMRLLPNGVKKTTELMSFLGTIYGKRRITDPNNIRNEASDTAWKAQPER